MAANEQNMTTAIQELLDRNAIEDCVHRYCRGADRLDRELMLSAYHADGIDEHGKFVGVAADFVDWALKAHTDNHLSTQHYVSNHRCEIEGDVAHAETYFMFVAMNQRGKVLQMNGGRYVDRFERREGQWRIAYRICLRDWANMDERPDMNDLSSFTSTRAFLPDEVRQFMNSGPASRRDASDPSYARPLVADHARVAAGKLLES
ncbi:MAG: nuclear transport factor 2 family protein [Comamonadaceae bacterium]|nr:MAG: nuclear transport factor 2 family protein [Comamonadaceae bacterium]